MAEECDMSAAQLVAREVAFPTAVESHERLRGRASWIELHRREGVGHARRACCRHS